MRRSTVPGARATRRALVAALAVFAVLSGTAWAAFATGVDVSNWQHLKTLDWSKAKADGLSFAFIKATEGRNYTNPYFASDWAATGQLGIYHGAYHFARPSKGTAAAQARYFVKVAGLQQGSGVLPPVLDLETTGGLGKRALRIWTRNWLETVQSLTGRDPMIYVSPNFWKNCLGNSTAFHAYPLWVAEYGVSMPEVPGGWPTWSFWQSTSSGSIDGIAGRVDIDHFNGGPSQLALMANVKDGSTPTDTTGATSPAPLATTLTVSASASSIHLGDSVTLSGTLRSATAGAPARQVSLWQQSPDSGTTTQVATAMTDASGDFSFPVTPTATASYFVKWTGDSVYAPATSPAVTVSVLQPASTTITLSPSRSSVYPGQDSVLSGTLSTTTAPLPGKVVRLWRQRAGGTVWRHAGRTTTDGSGRFSFDLKPTFTASYMAKWHGGQAYAASASPPVDVTYQPTIPTTVTVRLSRTRAYAGQRVDVTGTLTSPVGNLSAQQVQVYAQDAPDTDPTLAGTVSTDDAGAFSLTVGPTRSTIYTARFTGGSVYQPASDASATMTLLLPQQTRLDLTSGRTSLLVGHHMRLRGHLRTDSGTGVRGHRRIQIYRRLVGDSTWQRVGVTRTRGPGGFWSVAVSPRRSVVFKAVYGGAMRFTPSHSNRWRVHVH